MPNVFCCVYDFFSPFSFGFRVQQGRNLSEQGLLRRDKVQRLSASLISFLRSLSSAAAPLGTHNNNLLLSFFPSPTTPNRWDLRGSPGMKAVAESQRLPLSFLICSEGGTQPFTLRVLPGVDHAPFDRRVVNG